MALWRALIAVVLASALAVSAWAQEAQQQKSSILTLDADRLFVDSEFGKRMAQEFDLRRADLVAEGLILQAELEAEEAALAARRAGMAPLEFRALADAFDAKVQGIRKDQDERARELGQSGEADRISFLRAAQPVLEAIMIEFGAAVILDQRDVFLRAEQIDITSEAIERINREIGDGSSGDAPKQ
jgi:Skp family chaperone for outer membrane proteins